MAIIAMESEDKQFEQPEPGEHNAICAHVIDIGMQEVTFEGKVSQKRQVVLCFELEETLTEGEHAGKPFMQSKFYTLSLNEKATLRKDLRSWFSKDIPLNAEGKRVFYLEKLLGRQCRLMLEETKTGKRKIGTILPAAKGAAKLSVVSEAPPAWIVDKINAPVDTKGAAPSEKREDDIPY